MRACMKSVRIPGKRMLAAMMAAASLCIAGCAEKTNDDTYVLIDVGYLDSEQEYIEKYGTEGTYVTISGFATPEPVVTPVPTPVPTSKPTSKPKAEKDSGENKKDKEDKKNKEQEKAEPTPTPKPSKKKTPYAGKYEKVSLSYESSSDGIKFETTTLSGDAVSENLFAKNSITMINIWTQT